MTEAQRARAGRNTRSLSRAMLAAASVLAATTVAMLGSADTSYALWNSTATVDAGVVTFGSLSASLTVTPELGIPLTTGSPTRTGVITISNGGNVAADFTTSATIAGGSTAALAAVIAVRVWSTDSSSTCAAQTVPATGFSGTWSTVSAPGGTLSGRLPAGASATYCARTTLGNTSGVASASAVQVSLATSLTAGSWLSPAAAAFTQAFIDNAAPSVPTGLSANDITTTSATISWLASADNVAVTRYKLYRGTALIATVDQSPLSFTDPNLTPGTAYTYQVTAEDAAGNVSAKSAPVTLSTLTPVVPPTNPPIDPSAWYGIVSTGGNCLEASVSSNQLKQKQSCATSQSDEQSWKFQGPNADGYYRVVSRTSPVVAWEANGTVVAVKPPSVTAPAQLWKVRPGPGGTYLIESVSNSGQCMERDSSANVNLVACNDKLASQAFTLFLPGASVQRSAAVVAPSTVPFADPAPSPIAAPQLQTDGTPAGATAPTAESVAPPTTPLPPVPAVIVVVPALPVDPVTAPEAIPPATDATPDPLVPPVPAGSDASTPVGGDSA